MDEISSVATARVPMNEIVDRSAQNNSLPTYFLLLRPLVTGSNEHIEIRARLISALAGAASIPVFIALVFLWRGGGLTALIAGLLLALNPLHLWYSQEARGYALMLLFGAALMLYRYRVRQLLELERIRTRIATDLHDDIGASLSRMAILSEVVKRQDEVKSGTSRRMLTEIADSARGLVDAMSDIVWSIDPQRDDLRSVSTRIRQFASDVLEARGIKWELKLPHELETVKLKAEQRRQLLLIFKEALNNVVRHADCVNVTLSLALEGRALAGEVRDDGRGFQLEGTDQFSGNGRGGNGLKNMRARVAQLGGEISIASLPGQGTCLTFKVPLK